jgi:cell division septal protein FtsQ
MTVKAPAEKNFRRAKAVKPVRKRAASSWRWWRVPAVCAAAGLGLFLAYQALDFVVHASVLQVRRIVVRGHVRLSSGEVQALVDGLRGSNILTVDLAGYRSRLLQSRWIADAALRRVLPGTIEVFVSEREPIALCRINGQLYLIDRSAWIIDEFGPKYKQFDLPIVDGAARTTPAGEPLLDERKVGLAARVIDALVEDRALAAQVSQIDVSDAFDAVVLLHDDPARLHLGTTRFAERLQGYLDIAERLRETVPDMEYANLQFDGRVYVKPAGSSGVHSIVRSSRKD